MVLGIPDYRQHLVSVDHGGKDTAEPVLAVESLDDEIRRGADRAPANERRHQRLDQAAGAIQPEKHPVEQGSGRKVISLLLRRGDEQLQNIRSARVGRFRLQAAQNEQRHHDRARPVRHLANVKRKPARKQHDFHRNKRHGPPRNLSKKRQRDAGEHVGAGGAAAFQNGLARTLHVRRFRVVPGELERVINLDRAAQIHRAAVIERPTAVATLVSPEVNSQLLLKRKIHLVHEVHHQDVFGGDRAVRLELIAPVAVRVLLALEGGQSAGNRVFELQSRIEDRRRRRRLADDCGLYGSAIHQRTPPDLRRLDRPPGPAAFISVADKTIVDMNLPVNPGVTLEARLRRV